MAQRERYKAYNASCRKGAPDESLLDDSQRAELASGRKYAFVLAFVIGAAITPTPDPINQTIISLPIYFLFELGVILARFA